MNLAETYAYIKRMNSGIPMVTRELMYRLARCEVEQSNTPQARRRELLLANAMDTMAFRCVYSHLWPVEWDARTAWRESYAEARRADLMRGGVVFMRYPNNPKQW